jgi:excisionase family DNA binding protein
VTQESYPVSRREAARLLGYSERTIDRLCARGELRKAREGGRAVIERASIDAYRERLYDRPTESRPPADLRAAWLPELAHRRRDEGGVAA